MLEMVEGQFETLCLGKRQENWIKVIVMINWFEIIEMNYECREEDYYKMIKINGLFWSLYLN